jgi:K319L-like, PKD domain
LPENQSPVVDTGDDQSLVLPMNIVTLSATVSDDGLPSGALTLSWSLVSGPANLDIASPNSATTAVAFYEPGTYILELIADDGLLSATDQVQVQVDEGGGELVSLEVKIASWADDVEESESGDIYLESSDLELVFDDYDQAGNQLIGLRFIDLDIPKGSTVVSASLGFTVDEVSVDPCVLEIRGEAVDDAAGFQSVVMDVSSRNNTVSQVSWEPIGWSVVGDAGEAQRTTDLSTILQEIVNRSGWNSGNAVVLLISGQGNRTAESFDGASGSAPTLYLEYVTGPVVNKAPSVNAGADQVFYSQVEPLSLVGAVADDGLPLLPGTVVTSWSQVSGPAGAVFSDQSSLTTLVMLPSPGIFVFQLIAQDGELSASDQVALEFIDAGSEVISIVASVADDMDDAEESLTGKVYLDSSDLELVNDTYNSAGNQHVGLRFRGLVVPVGATILNASIQFVVDEETSGQAALTIHAQNADDPAAFVSTAGNITDRPLTLASVPWSPAPWTGVGQAGLAQQTPDLTTLVQAVVNRDGWLSGNAIAFVISGSGTRTAMAFESGMSLAAKLNVDYVMNTKAAMTQKQAAVELFAFRAKALSLGKDALALIHYLKESLVRK